jgi:hypothetical protein
MDRIEQLKQAGNKAFGIACQSNPQSRASAAAALLAAAASLGVSGYDAKWVASYGLSQFGYGGGL